MIAQWIDRYFANLRVLGSNPVYNRVCGMFSPKESPYRPYVPGVTSAEAKQTSRILLAGRLRGLAGSAVDHRSLAPEFKY